MNILNMSCNYLNPTENWIITYHIYQWWVAERRSSSYYVAFHWTPTYINRIPQAKKKKNVSQEIAVNSINKCMKSPIDHLLLLVMIDARSKRNPSTCISVTQYLFQMLSDSKNYQQKNAQEQQSYICASALILLHGFGCSN